MDPLKILSAVNVKVVGAQHPDGRPLPLIGMRPQHNVFDYRGGELNPYPPIQQALIEHGGTRFTPDNAYDVPHPDWTITLPTTTSYRVEYQGETLLSNNHSTPELWGQFVREAGWCLIVCQRMAGPEVRGTELLAEMDTGNCFAVTARLV